MIGEFLTGALVLALLFAGFYGIEHFGELPEDLDEKASEDDENGR
jgi:hypothetical protein